MERLEDIKDYWTMRAEGYSESILNELGSERSDQWLGTIESYLDGRNGLDVLDIGTGPGLFPVLLGGAGHRVTAVDYTAAMLDEARKNCERFGIKATFHRMDAQNLDFKDESFDLVISRNLVWDLERPFKAYEEWFRVLRPDGKVLVFDGNHYLHLYDEDYAKMEIGKDYQARGHSNIKGVDTNIIKEIARDLPLSRERRPQWDVDAFVKIGASSITVDMKRDRPISGKENAGGISLPFNFIISAKKGQ